MTNKKKHIRTLRILITNNCTLECHYCCAEGHQSQFNHFNVQNIENTISIINQFFDVDRLKLTGGEPFCVSEINDIIERIYKTKLQHQIVSIVSNGTNTEKILQSANSHKNLDLTISLPTLDKDIFQVITGKAELLQKVIKTIDLLISENNYPTKINCVLVDGQTNSIDNIKSIIDRYSKFHNVSIRFLELSINSINSGVIKKLNYKSTYSIFSSIMARLGFQLVQGSDTRESCLFSKDGVRIKYIKYFCGDNCFSCPETKTSLWVSCDGYISCCPNNSDRHVFMSHFSYDEIYRQISENENKF